MEGARAPRRSPPASPRGQPRRARRGRAASHAFLAAGLAAEATGDAARPGRRPHRRRGAARRGRSGGIAGRGGPASPSAALPALTRMARRADLVHCTNWDPSLYGRLAALLARRPVIVTEHGSIAAIERLPGGRAARALGRRSPSAARPLTAATVYCAMSSRIACRRGRAPGSPCLHRQRGPGRRVRAAARTGRRGPIWVLGRGPGHRSRGQLPPREEPGQTLATVAALRSKPARRPRRLRGRGPGEEAVRRQAAELRADWAVFLGARPDVPRAARPRRPARAAVARRDHADGDPGGDGARRAGRRVRRRATSGGSCGRGAAGPSRLSTATPSPRPAGASSRIRRCARSSRSRGRAASAGFDADADGAALRGGVCSGAGPGRPLRYGSFTSGPTRGSAAASRR